MTTSSQELTRQSKLHARTLAALNHCIGTARRDAACARLFELIEKQTWRPVRNHRLKLYEGCIELLGDAILSTERSSPILYNPNLAMADRPLLHFLRLMQQIFQTVHSMCLHIEEAQQETEQLRTHVAEDVCQILLNTADGFEAYEQNAMEALKRLVPTGRTLVTGNSHQRQAAFSSTESDRYAKSYASYLERYQVLPRD